MMRAEVMDIVWNTLNDVVVERCGLDGGIVFDSETSLYRDFKKIRHEKIQRIEPDSDGGRKFLHIYI